MSEEIMNNVVVNEPSKKEKKPKKKKSLGRKIFEYVFIGLFAAFAAFVIAGNIQGEIKKKENFGQSIRFGIGSFVVLTNSMEPEIPQDSAIITYKSDIDVVFNNYQNGVTQDLTFANIDCGITFRPDIADKWQAEGIYPQPVITNRIMTHRLIEMHINEEAEYGNGRYIFVTAGINHEGIESKMGQYQYFTEKEYLGVVKISNQFLGKIFKFLISPFGLIVILLIPAAYLIIVSSIDIYKAMKSSEAAEGDASVGKLEGISTQDRERLKKELLDEMINKKKKEKDDNAN